MQTGEFQFAHGGILEGENDLYERVIVDVALRLQLFDQALKGQVLVIVRFLGSGLHLREYIQEGWLATVNGTEVGTQGQGVDKEADQGLKLSVIAVGNR